MYGKFMGWINVHLGFVNIEVGRREKQEHIRGDLLAPFPLTFAHFRLLRFSYLYLSSLIRWSPPCHDLFCSMASGEQLSAIKVCNFTILRIYLIIRFLLHWFEWSFCCSQDAKVLMVGAGGIGCELLKTLALSGFQDIHIVSQLCVFFYYYIVQRVIIS